MYALLYTSYDIIISCQVQETILILLHRAQEISVFLNKESKLNWNETNMQIIDMFM